MKRNLNIEESYKDSFFHVQNTYPLMKENKILN
jgi:hypothetical protein